MSSQPVSKQPGSGSSSELYPFSNKWQRTLFGSFKPCPRSAYACLCTPCFTAQLTDRQGDHFLTCCLNPCVLSGIRTKVRTAYSIEGSLLQDFCVTGCCVQSCAAMQIEHELNHHDVPAKRIK